MNRQQLRPAKRLGHFGSIVFGLGLFLLGWVLKHFLADSGLYAGDQATTLWRFTVGMMVFGIVIAVANVAWIIFCLVMARRG